MSDTGECLAPHRTALRTALRSAQRSAPLRRGADDDATRLPPLGTLVKVKVGAWLNRFRFSRGGADAPCSQVVVQEANQGDLEAAHSTHVYYYSPSIAIRHSLKNSSTV